MRIMLWKPGLDDGSTGELPHIGLGILANDIKRAGHEVFLSDNHFDPQGPPAEQLLKDGVDLLCISLVSQEWPLPVTQQILGLAHQLGIPVWLGGPHAHGTAICWKLMNGSARSLSVKRIMLFPGFSPVKGKGSLWIVSINSVDPISA